MAHRMGSAAKPDRPFGFRSKLPPSPSPGSVLRRSVPSGGSAQGVPDRVRVAVRLRPRNAEESAADTDFAKCVELEPELKRLKLLKNNWDTDTYEFDDVLSEHASQKRVYEAVAKPVVESVLNGYNGTVMAYGQTGTGKTFTLGQLGDEDISDRGIIVRAMEDILAGISLETDSVSVSYLQLYMDNLQDLLKAANNDIPIVEDPKTGDVSVPGATVVDIKNQLSFLELLRVGEAHRVTANSKLNTESSRSHAILMVNVKRCVSIEDGDSSHLTKSSRPTVWNSKLVVVDLAGSERAKKSGSEGHMFEEAKCINLSLSALGKCINSLAENSSHVPFRDSKLTRLLTDSFGGSARTSLIVTIGPSPHHLGETSSTILFGQRAMKVENMLKIKEEPDYKSLLKKLQVQVDMLTAQNERQNKAYQDEVERLRKHILEIKRNFADELEKERQMVSNQKQDHEGNQEEVSEVQELLQKEIHLRKEAEKEVQNLKIRLALFTQSEAGGTADIVSHNMLEEEPQHKKKLEEDWHGLKRNRSQLSQLDLEAEQMTSMTVGHSYPRDVGNAKAPVSTLFEQGVGLQKTLSLLKSEDANVRIQAVKEVAKLAAEETNQKRIIDAGGLTSLLMLLGSSEDETVRRVTAGAIANLALNEANQEQIMVEGGISLLAAAAADANDPKTLRMVAVAIANLCGNDKLQTNLWSEGGITALLGTVRCRRPDVISQVARGIANFAKCESRACSQGIKSGRSILIEVGALPWIMQNANDESASIRQHIELALCHLAQHEVNAKDMISGGALCELVRISRGGSREDIKTLARRILKSSPTFLAELHRLNIDY